MKTLAAVGWTLGLSYRGLAALYRLFGVEIERMSAWRDVQEQASELERARKWKPVRVLWVDGADVRTGGVTSDQETRAIPAAVPQHIYTAETILNGMDQLLEVQQLYRETRGLHCSAISDGQSVRFLAEDIGRHNTLDKLSGMLLLQPGTLSHRMILTTGRISADMLQKSALLGASLVISRTSPTTLSIEHAQQLGITLVGYARRNQFSIYTHPERVLIPTARLA